VEVRSLRPDYAFQRILCRQLAHKSPRAEQIENNLGNLAPAGHDARVTARKRGLAGIVGATVSRPLAGDDTRRRLHENEPDVANVEILIEDLHVPVRSLDAGSVGSLPHAPIAAAMNAAKRKFARLPPRRVLEEEFTA
jgi:hypothetical protein